MTSQGKVILILSAMNQEHEAVVRSMTQHQQMDKYGIVIVEGWLFGKQCVAALSGVGKVASAFTSQYLI